MDSFFRKHFVKTSAVFATSITACIAAVVFLPLLFREKSSISFSYWEVVAFVVLVWIVFFLYAYLRNSYTLKKTKMEELDSDYDTDDVDKDDLD